MARHHAAASRHQLYALHQKLQASTAALARPTPKWRSPIKLRSKAKKKKSQAATRLALDNGMVNPARCAAKAQSERHGQDREAHSFDVKSAGKDKTYSRYCRMKKTQ